MSNQPTEQQIFGTTFQDTQDPTRFLKIKEVKTNTVIARVFFGKSKDAAVYSGCIEAPKQAFHFDGSSRTGYNPATNATIVETTKKSRAALRDEKKRQQEQRRDEEWL